MSWVPHFLKNIWGEKWKDRPGAPVQTDSKLGKTSLQTFFFFVLFFGCYCEPGQTSLTLWCPVKSKKRERYTERKLLR